MPTFNISAQEAHVPEERENPMRLINTADKGFKKSLEAIVRRGSFETGGVEKEVTRILEETRRRGDKALVEYTNRFDGLECTAAELRVRPQEIKKAYRLVSKDVLELFETAAGRVRDFHRKQKAESWFTTEPGGSILGQIVTPMERVGIYVPGGKAAYPSSVLMNAIPAQIAGVESIAMCTPAPGGELNPYTLVAADMLGIDEIYRLGGAQAVGAMAYGTKSVDRVDKIVGPGNIYVATAKKLVYGNVDIDMIAGPSEILIVADETADPAYLAADLLSQAEHDEMAVCILVTDSGKLAEKVRNEVERQTDELPKGSRERARAALEGQGLLIVVRNFREGFDIMNRIAPEHLEIVMEDALGKIPEIRNAGSVFIGPNTPEPVGDYLAGPNHVLPTGGTARFSSTLGVESFVKRSNLISFSEKDLKKWGAQVARFARLEGLEAHARSVLARKRGK
jgi:histidinol dehydrogenase